MSVAPGYEIDWNLVRTFVSVVEAGSLAGAARALEMAYPTVARHVQLLEANLGVALFDRSAAGLRLNDAGQQLADVAERMRREAMTLESIGESVRSATTGRVRVTIAEVFGDLIPELLGPIKDQPGAAERYVELIVSPQRLNLLDREADIAVRHVRPEQSELICRQVGGLPMGAWASRDYVAARGSATLESASGHLFIDGLSMRGFEVALARLGCRLDESQVAFRTDSLQSQRRAAEMGWGIAGLPNYMAERSPGLVAVFEDVPDPVKLEIWLVARPAMRQQPLLRMVFDALAEGLASRFGTGVSSPPQAAGSLSRVTA